MKFVRAMGRCLADQRGQAMVEYSTLTFAILLGAGAVAFAFPIPAMPGSGISHDQTLVMALYRALQTYVDSFYYALHLMAP